MDRELSSRRVIRFALLVAVTTAAPTNGPAVKMQGGKRTFHATGQTTAGAGAATIKVQGSNVDTPAVDGDWVEIGSIDLVLGTTKAGDGFSSDAPWKHVRGRVTAISGAGSSVNLDGGC